MSNAPGTKPEEKRKFSRLSILADVAYNKKDATEKEKLSFTKNVGKGGICLIAYEELKVSDVLDLKILLPEEEKPLSVFGKVIWVKKFSIGIGNISQNERFDVGIEFLNINESDQEKINKYIFSHKLVE